MRIVLEIRNADGFQYRGKDTVAIATTSDRVIDVTVVRGVVGGGSCSCEGHRARKRADTVFHLH